MLKGDCESGQGNYKTAMTDYQAAQQLDDKKDPELSARLLASMGSAQLNMGDEAAGLQSINQAEQLYPKGTAAYQYLASYYINKGNLNAALNPLIKLAQLNPQNVQAQINIGDIYVRQNNFTEAQAAFTKALQIDPKSGDAQFGLAEIAAKKGDIKTTDTELQKAIAIDAGNASLYDATIAQFLEAPTTDKTDHTADAAHYADAATKADPNNPSAWYSLGIAYADQNKKDMANSALRKAFDLYKARGDQNGMQQTNAAYGQVNKGQSLMGGSNGTTNGQGGGTGKNIETPGDMPH
jgi:tetratricopeptide (TPR) repeat protein